MTIKTGYKKLLDAMNRKEKAESDYEESYMGLVKDGVSLDKIPIFMRASGSSIQEFSPYKYPVMEVSSGIPTGTVVMGSDDVSDSLISKLWKKMFEMPVIVRCSHCNSHNVITNPTCIQCGAPLGDYKPMMEYG